MGLLLKGGHSTKHSREVQLVFQVLQAGTEVSSKCTDTVDALCQGKNPVSRTCCRAAREGGWVCSNL